MRHYHRVLLFLVVVAHSTNFKVSWGGGVDGEKDNFVKGKGDYVKDLNIHLGVRKKALHSVRLLWEEA